jgi:glycosyltransferase involved in cell wall biosynthesis
MSVRDRMPNGRVRVGIWSALVEPGCWQGEDVRRMLTGLVEGAAACGTVTFCVDVSATNYAPTLRILQQLAARKGVDWTLTTDGAAPVEGLPPIVGDRQQPRSPPPDLAGQRTWLMRRPPSQVRWLLVGLVVILLPLQILHTLLRPAWRFLWRNGLSAAPGLLRLARLAWRDPVVAAAALVPTLDERKSWPAQGIGRALGAWHAAHRTNYNYRNVNPVGLPEADGWLLLEPDCVGGLNLPGRRFVLFLDALPLDFPFHWEAAEWEPGARWDTWVRRASETLAGVDGVITPSNHVAERHVTRRFGVPCAKVTPVPAATSDLRHLLPVCASGREPTRKSRCAAADIFRRHAAERGWSYLAEFPFEDVQYVVVSGDDRPMGNIPLAVEAVRLLLLRDYFDIKLFMTAHLDPSKPDSRVRHAVRDAKMRFEALSVPDLPPEVHAALYHCGAVTVHAAFCESGVGALPFWDSISVGTPCLLARGPHSLELLAQEPALEPFLFDPYDAEALARLIRQIIADRPAALGAQDAMLARLTRRSWGDVAEEYAAAISGLPVGCHAVRRDGVPVGPD